MLEGLCTKYVNELDKLHNIAYTDSWTDEVLRHFA